MNFRELEIPGVWEIEFEPLRDERGSFRRHFCENEFRRHGIDAAVKQANISENAVKGTLRGFHFQQHPHWEPKTVSCLRGSVYAIIVDLRPEKPTYRKWVSLEMNSRGTKSVHVPVGCAMAWLTLEDSTSLHYFMGENYIPGLAAGVRYNDPQFGFRWPMDPVVISEKDKNLPDFDPKFLKAAN